MLTVADTLSPQIGDEGNLIVSDQEEFGELLVDFAAGE